MKKKVILVLVLLSIAAITNVHAFGIGAQYNFFPGSTFGKAVSLTHGFSLLVSPIEPLNIAANYFLPPKGQRNYNGLAVTADYSPKFLTFRLFGSKPTLVGDGKAWWFNINIGIGGYANFWFGPNYPFTVTGGLRLPVGFNVLLGSGLFEIFAHCAPSVGLNFTPAFGTGEWAFPVEIGARVWLFKKKTY
ncbi:MAG: hypothetical protein FWB73_06875 [Treponema sp.]|nr:hypothetical protein [Treponema sp.]MCL2273264.1 hypothetical protein [Treponema sp.]